MISVDETKLREVLDALETGLDCARDKAEDTHDSYRGYYPERHASVDRDVAEMESAMTIVQAMLEQKPDDLHIAYMAGFHAGKQKPSEPEIKYADYEYQFKEQS